MTKRNIQVFITIIFCMIFITGCGKKPDATVERFCDAMRGMNFDEMTQYAINTNEMINEDEFMNNDEFSNVLMEYFKTESKDITYKILNSEVNGDKAVVTISFEYNDLSDIISESFGTYVEKAFGMAFSGQEIDNEKLFGDALNLARANHIDEKKKDTKSINLECTLLDNEWKVSKWDEEIADVLFGNGYTTLQEIAKNLQESFSETAESDTSEETADEDKYIEIPLNEELELATIKIRINSCEEKSELKGEWDSTEAQAGTKFVQLNVTIENITKDPWVCNLGAPLVDSDGRSFNEYDESMMCVDDYIAYREISPNIPLTGTITYLVPEDAEGFYLPIVHADTNQVYHLLAQ